jgi:hypothetical protein
MKVFLFLFLAMASPASARLGETVQECRKRYGKEIEVDNENGVMAFEKEGWMIAVMFHKGRAGALSFQHKKEPGGIFNPKISDVEIATLLKANGGGQEWTASDDIDFINRKFFTPNASRAASYDTVESRLFVMTKEYLDFTAEKKADAEKAKIDGF